MLTMAHARLGSTTSSGITKLASTGPAPSRRQTRRQKGTGASVTGASVTGAALGSQLPAISHSSVSGSRAATVESSAGPAAASGGPRMTKESVCIDILRSGHVNAFVDFFYLSHRADPNPDKARPDGGRNDIHLSQTDLGFLKRTLCDAETSRRRGDVRAVLDAYAGLSEHYAAAKDSNTAVYFYEKCLEVAQSVGDVSAELHTLHSLGAVYKSNGDLDSAIAYFEAHRDTASQHAAAALGDGQSTDAHMAAAPFKAEVRRANSALVGVYGAAAESAAAQDDQSGCLHARLQALEAACSSGDAAAEAATNFHVGRTQVASGQPAEGAPALLRFLDLSSDAAVALTAEALGATRAAGYAGLAAAYHALGSTEKATACLHDFLSVAEEAGDVAAQAHACSSLGDIHNRHGEFSRAVKSFEKSYKLYRSLVLSRASTHPDDMPSAASAGSGSGSSKKHSMHRDVDRAKVHLGMARGNATMGTYVNVIVTDVGALLKWKNKRTYMKAGDIASGAVDA